MSYKADRITSYAFFIAIFCAFSHNSLCYRILPSGRSLITSSDSVCKFMSCQFLRSVPDLVNHQYGICRMYSEEDPQDFHLLVPNLYPYKRVMLLLSTDAYFNLGNSFFWEFTSEYLPQRLTFGRPSLAHKRGRYSIFRTELSVSIIGGYGICSHTSYHYIHELLLHTDIVIQTYALIEYLERDVLNRRYAIYL